MPIDEGTYQCKAHNSEGSVQGSAVVKVERIEVPGIEIYPETSQMVILGESALFQCRVLSGKSKDLISIGDYSFQPIASQENLSE